MDRGGQTATVISVKTSVLPESAELWRCQVPSRCDWYPCRMTGPWRGTRRLSDALPRPCNVPPRLSSLACMNTLPSWAQKLARELLQEPLPRRWAHVQGVADRARGLAPVLGTNAELLEAAAWLHDIGYAPSLATTGLHQLDGARYLRDGQHADAMLCRLVAHHSCAIIEAGVRGLADVLSSEFDPAPDELASVLTCCDMTTSPDGQPVLVEQRLAEIHDRYGSGHLVSRSIQRATPMILRAVEQVHQRATQTA